MRRLSIGVLVLVTALACQKKESTAPPSVEPSATAAASATAATNGTTTTATTETTTATQANAGQPSLISFSAGALVVKKPQEYSDSWSALYMTDEDPATGWATPKGSVGEQSFVLALIEKTELDSLAFDDASIDGDGRGAKDITVEMSDTSVDAGFQKIAAVSLADRANDQTFPVSAKVPGRWIRFTVHNNHGSPEYTELFDVRGYGRQLTHTPVANVSGTYETNYGNFHVRQEGNSLTGCYEHDDGVLSGGIDGPILKFEWTQSHSKGPAVMVITTDGSQLYGLWWYEGNKSASGVWNGKKIAAAVGTCPHWSGGAASQMASDLGTAGRTRVYGINFDSDSDHIRDDSKPTLEQITEVLKKNPGWKMTIEGHTDSTASAEHNQQLSQARAVSVKNYLVAAGIDASRLGTSGFGATKPVADNGTALGRAQNRRVELVRQ